MQYLFDNHILGMSTTNLLSKESSNIRELSHNMLGSDDGN